MWRCLAKHSPTIGVICFCPRAPTYAWTCHHVFFVQSIVHRAVYRAIEEAKRGCWRTSEFSEYFRGLQGFDMPLESQSGTRRSASKLERGVLLSLAHSLTRGIFIATRSLAGTTRPAEARGVCQSSSTSCSSPLSPSHASRSVPSAIAVEQASND